MDIEKELIPSGNYLTQTTLQSWILRILMQKNSFFRVSSNCPRCYLMMLKQFLPVGALRHSKQPPKLLNTSWDHLKKFFSQRIFDLRKPFLLMELTNPLKMAFYEGFQNLKAFSRWKLWPRYDRGSFFGSYCNFLSSGFCLKWFLAEKINFELRHRPKSAQIHAKVKENSFKKLEKNHFFRFSSNCPRCCLMMLKRFLGALRHPKPPPKLLNTLWDHLKKFFSHRIFDPRKPFFAYGADQPFENGILWGFSKTKGFFQTKAMA